MISVENLIPSREMTELKVMMGIQAASIGIYFGTLNMYKLLEAILRSPRTDASLLPQSRKELAWYHHDSHLNRPDSRQPGTWSKRG